MKKVCSVNYFYNKLAILGVSRGKILKIDSLIINCLYMGFWGLDIT